MAGVVAGAVTGAGANIGGKNKNTTTASRSLKGLEVGGLGEGGRGWEGVGGEMEGRGETEGRGRVRQEGRS